MLLRVNTDNDGEDSELHPDYIMSHEFVQGPAWVMGIGKYYPSSSYSPLTCTVHILYTLHPKKCMYKIVLNMELYFKINIHWA